MSSTTEKSFCYELKFLERQQDDSYTQGIAFTSMLTAQTLQLTDFTFEHTEDAKYTGLEKKRGYILCTFCDERFSLRG